MKRNNREKGEVNVISQPKHPILSLFVVDQDKIKFPLTDTLHDCIFKVGETTDIFFIFLGPNNSLLPDVFSSLYGGCGYIEEPGRDMTGVLFKVFKYAREIFETHKSFTIWKMEEEVKDPDKVCESVLKGCMSDLKWPIFNIRRLSPSELCDIYTKEEGGDRFKGFLEDLYERYWKKGTRERGDNRYSTWTSNSPVMFFNFLTIDKFLEAYEREEDGEWIRTFSWTDYRYLLASLTKHLGIKIQPGNLWEVVA